jgi:hypothetical protein
MTPPRRLTEDDLDHLKALIEDLRPSDQMTVANFVAERGYPELAWTIAGLSLPARAEEQS